MWLGWAGEWPPEPSEACPPRPVPVVIKVLWLLPGQPSRKNKPVISKLAPTQPPVSVAIAVCQWWWPVEFFRQLGSSREMNISYISMHRCSW